MIALGIAQVEKAAPPTPVYGGGWGGIFSSIRESFTGAWQRGIEVNIPDVISNPTVFACTSLISSDIAKNRLRLIESFDGDIWTETENSSYSPVLRSPNRYQTTIEFIKVWLTSLLVHGNTYVLLQRNRASKIEAMYILDPQRVKVLVGDDGSVYYELKRDNLTGLQDDSITVPASEVIHDRYETPYHPLIGVSPIHACGAPAMQSLTIQRNSAKFFANGSKPGGVITAPAAIPPDVAGRIKDYWDANFTGENAGRVAVLGNGMAYTAMTVNANDAQLVQQLDWTDAQIAKCYHVPMYMLGGDVPNYNNVQALWQQYYSQCLQIRMELIEAKLDRAFGFVDGKVEGRWLGIEFDLDDLLRMDTATQVKTLAEAVKGGIDTPNEARRKRNRKPLPGGDTIYLQEQNWPIQHLASRPLPEREPTKPAEMTLDAGKAFDTFDALAFQAALEMRMVASARRGAVVTHG